MTSKRLDITMPLLGSSLAGACQRCYFVCLVCLAVTAALSLAACSFDASSLRGNLSGDGASDGGLDDVGTTSQMGDALAGMDGDARGREGGNTGVGSFGGINATGGMGGAVFAGGMGGIAPVGGMGGTTLQGGAPGTGGNVGAAGAGGAIVMGGNGNPSSQLRGEWRLNEGTGTAVADSSQYGNAGTLVNATWITGVEGSALRFETTFARVVVPDSESLRISGSSLTLEAWVRVTKLPQDVGRKVIADKRAATNAGYGLSVRFIPAPQILCAQIGSTETCVQASFPLLEWRHVVAVLDDGRLQFFVNGTLTGEASNSEMLVPNNAALTLGNQALASASAVFLGDIDNIRVWATARTSAQICQAANRQWNGASCL